MKQHSEGEAYVDVRATQGHGLPGNIFVQVSLTSPVVREEQLAGGANGAAAADDQLAQPSSPSGKDRLNTKHCLHALALLRRAKWFQARANSLQNCVLVIRVMRDFCLRSPVWANLDFWAVELLVERAVYSAGVPLSPGDAFRRVFETLSAGILLTSPEGWSPGLVDPCEKDVVDACGNLSVQEREDITAAAQVNENLIIVPICGLGRLPPSMDSMSSIHFPKLWTAAEFFFSPFTANVASDRFSADIQSTGHGQTTT